ARLAETDALADLEPLGGPRERPPTAIVDALNQRRLDRSNGLAPNAYPIKARRDDPRVVDDQRVAGREEVREVAHARVLEVAVGSDNQHSRAVPRVRRLERDAFRRKDEIEGVDAHDGHRRAVKTVKLSSRVLWQRSSPALSLSWP